MDSQTIYIPERRDAKENHERILEAALQVFAERGEQAEVKDIAARAGVGVGTIYRHFENREQLLDALIERTHAEVLEQMRLAAQSPSAMDALRAVIATGLDVMQRHGALMEMLMSRQAEEDLMHERKHAEVDAILTSIIQRGIDSREFRADLVPGVLIAVMEALFISGKLMELAQKKGPDEAAREMCDFLMHAACPGRS